MTGGFNFDGLAAVILAVAALAAQFVALYTIHRKVTTIDNAVNGNPAGSPTISEEVTEIKDTLLPGGSV